MHPTGVPTFKKSLIKVRIIDYTTLTQRLMACKYRMVGKIRNKSGIWKSNEYIIQSTSEYGTMPNTEQNKVRFSDANLCLKSELVF